MATTYLVHKFCYGVKQGSFCPVYLLNSFLTKTFLENPEKNRHVLLKILLYSICGKTLRICIYTLAKWLTGKHNYVKVFE